ncbi:hypothetical protein SAY86_016203 [Trapa natans]|uniref:RING-type E3 ubiquitin transferase n=1 Tax=Trapa natans TaxID=22666 RepID=A0AAN7QZ85_TRANT|nr:hypothetical protein SAY86_016203 [Trapa natans]
MTADSLHLYALTISSFLRFKNRSFMGSHHARWPRPREARNPRSEWPGLAGIMAPRGNRSKTVLSRILDVFDRHRGWRLDVDHMSYEQLLELGNKIGNVNTGLKDDEIDRCIRRIMLTNLSDLIYHFPAKTDWKCSICQEEYEVENELGMLECGHGYHFGCVEKWLLQKNVCPICKSEAVPRTSGSH